MSVFGSIFYRKKLFKEFSNTNKNETVEKKQNKD